MNRLVLIGNGFDLAHGLKTSYKDFLFWYLEKAFMITEQNFKFEDQILNITHRPSIYVRPSQNHIRKLIDAHYFTGFSQLQSQSVESEKFGVLDNPYYIKCKSDLLINLLSRCSPTNWVDIENEFYVLLVLLLKKEGAEKTRLVKNLNDDLSHLINQLEDYLSEISFEDVVHGYEDIIFGEFGKEDFNDPQIQAWSQVPNNPIKRDYSPSQTYILNFNYTDIVERYIPTDRSRVKINYIHGKIKDLNNPIIFGFGDELDKNYEEFESQHEKGFFHFIKSFWYLRTNNYQNLMRFLSYDFFQVVVLGHSCGLSDRTMLNTIFTHQNCKAIQIYYYRTGEYENNYTEITQEISRQFGKDKAAFRAKVISLPKSKAMPQYTN